MFQVLCSRRAILRSVGMVGAAMGAELIVPRYVRAAVQQAITANDASVATAPVVLPENSAPSFIAAPGGVERGTAAMSTIATPPSLDAVLASIQPNILHSLSDENASSTNSQLLGRVRVIGDMHFGFTTPARLDAVARDLLSISRPDAILTTGDEVHFGLKAEYDAAEAWFQNMGVPMYTVTGNHTFWNATERKAEKSSSLYQRFVDRWNQPMPYVWELGGMRFIDLGPTAGGPTPADASINISDVVELAGLLAKAPKQPTVLVMHSPLKDTVCGDDGTNASCYTSDDPGFYQARTHELLEMLSGAPQVKLIITGHTHSPLKADGLLTTVSTGKHLVPHFNAMALPFIRRLTSEGPMGPQSLITWELDITQEHLLLVARDHLSRWDIARAVIPLKSAANNDPGYRIV